MTYIDDERTRGDGLVADLVLASGKNDVALS